MKPYLFILRLALAGLGLCQAAEMQDPTSRKVSGGASYDIHAEVAKSPGRSFRVPAGDHHISREIVLTGQHVGLYGPGRIVMTDPARPIVVVRGASEVRIKDITLMRSKGRMDSTQPGLVLDDCRDASVEGVRVIDNRSPAGSIRMHQCRNVRVVHCDIINYMTVTVDDRTTNAAYGYAFRVVDGTGILVSDSQGTHLGGNSIIERTFVPTKEMRDRLQLGQVVKPAAQRGALVSEDLWKSDYHGHWHQGSGIAVTSPWATALTRITDNLIENPAQGIDINSDHVIVSGNIINNAFFGLKATHGSRNVIITGNQFIRGSLIGIAISPAAASGPPMPKTASEPERPANTDGGHVLANNVFANFGYGDAWWMWEGSTILPVGPAPISIGVGQLPHDPPLRDVLVTGNIVYDSGRDGVLREGAVRQEGPRYNYAVFFQDKDV